MTQKEELTISKELAYACAEALVDKHNQRPDDSTRIVSFLTLHDQLKELGFSFMIASALKPSCWNGVIPTEDENKKINKILAVKNLVKALTDDEQQLLKDAINLGSWGDCEQEFLRYPDAIGRDNLETVYAMGYCTNDAHKAGHFQGCVVSSMFGSIYRKMCSYNRNKIGHILCHCNDWWGDGSGDMLFIREEWYKAFEQWAKGGEE